MKIIVNSKFLSQHISGVQRYAMEISRRLKESMEHILFLSPHNILHDDLAKELEAVVIGKRTGHLWEQIDLPLFLRRNFGNKGYVLVNLTNTAPLFSSNNFLTLHDITFISFSKSYSFLFSTYYKLIIPVIVKRAKAVFTVSETAKKELQGYFHLNQQVVHVTYNAIDGENFTETRFENKYMQVILQEKGVERYMLAVSMFNPIKNLERLIEAFVKADLPGFKLVIVGDHYKSFRKSKKLTAYRKLPNLVFLGRINDVQQLNFLYQNAYAFVFPSLYESFGIPPLEAMASGCAAIVSTAGALPEICGDAAFYVNPLDVADIANSLINIAGNESMRKDLVRKGKDRVKAFNWEHAASVIRRQLTANCVMQEASLMTNK